MMKVPAGRLTAVFVLGLIGLTPPSLSAQVSESSVRDREAQRIATLERIIPSVVCVMSSDGNGGGSGVLISPDGYAISNYHVVSGSGSFMKCGLSDGKLYDAVLVGIDPTGDVALIKLTGRDDFPYAVPGNSDQVRTGDEVLALGNPFLLSSDFTPTVTFGIVSGVNRYQYPAGTFLEYTDCIQIDASINPGNSGGPLFDILGNWIGINGRASFEKRGRVNAGAAYAISVRQVLLFTEHLKCGLIVDHGISDFTVETSSDGRVLVSQVSEISEAWRRGLRPQDELLTFGGRLIGSANDFQNIQGIFPEGTRLPMTWRDGNGNQSATIRLRPLHDFQQAPELPGNRRPPMPENPEDGEPAPGLTPRDATPDAVPAELAGLFEGRDGFANYHFNKLRQEAIAARLRAAIGTLPEPQPTWEIEFRTASDGTPPADGNPAGAEMSGILVAGVAGAGLTLDGRDWYQSAAEPTTEDEPPAFPGLLIAALQWHRLFTQPLTSFDEVVARGQLKHLPSERIANILETREGTRISHWYFADEQPFPFAVDVEYAQGTDQTRLLFDSWTTKDAVPFPERIGRVDPATEKVIWLSVTRFAVRKAAGKQAMLFPATNVNITHSRGLVR